MVRGRNDVACSAACDGGRRYAFPPYGCCGHLCSAISAHFCAVVPNFRMPETDIDSVPWRDELVTAVPVIENGEMLLPQGPGWGIDIDEAAVRAHPPRR